MAASKYEFRIRGRLSEPMLERFDPLESDLERVETILHGPVRGLELIEVRRLPD